MRDNVIGFLKRNWKGCLFIAVAALAMNYAVIFGDAYLSSYSFCTSCHSMSYPANELKSSSHYGRLGFSFECKDCHLPPELLPRLAVHVEEGVRDMVSSIRLDLSTEEKFDAFRPLFAHRARMQLKKWDSAPCRVCHADPKPASDFARMFHGRMKEDRLTCIDCHQNLFHKRVPAENLSKVQD